MTTRSTGDLKKFENFENKFSFLMLQFVKSWMNKGYAKDKLQIVNNLEFYCSLPCFKRKKPKKKKLYIVRLYMEKEEQNT
jgi:hypothetical protein